MNPALVVHNTYTIPLREQEGARRTKPILGASEVIHSVSQPIQTIQLWAAEKMPSLQLEPTKRAQVLLYEAEKQCLGTALCSLCSLIGCNE